MNVLTIEWFLLVSVALGCVVAAIMAALVPAIRSRCCLTKIMLFLAMIFAALLLMRPHEETLVGLDNSCYRLMGHSFAQGRGLHDMDRQLRAVPPAVRRAFLLEY